MLPSSLTQKSSRCNSPTVSDVRADLGRLFVPGRRDRRLQPQGGGLCLWGADDLGPCPLGAEHGAAHPRPESVIHHSDQGSQYTSIAFGNRCREMGVRPSIGSVGDAYDNAMFDELLCYFGV